MATNKRKTTTAIVAGVTALALLLGGTFAWTSISQQARNEAIVDINPGGRLHDDFNGTNKDVYVENFGDNLTGVDIFARIRLDQYVEVGPDAGKNLTEDMANRNVTALKGGASNDLYSWETYIPGETIENGKVSANDYWDWTLGNADDHLPYYMPTFNKNKDSLKADINGTWQGTVKGDIVYYDDYKVYDENSTKTDTEVYDHDSNTEEETKGTTSNGVPAYSTTDINTPIDDAHVYLSENVKHNAEQITSGATVITMQQWIDGGMQLGNYWVYDTDGWAYWANPIAPQTTTGLLMDGVTMSKVPDENWYFGINVVGQFATASDIYEFDNMTDGATKLVDKLTGKVEENPDNPDEPTYTDELVLSHDNGENDTVSGGEWLIFNANVYDENSEYIAGTSEVTFKLTDQDGKELTQSEVAAASASGFTSTYMKDNNLFIADNIQESGIKALKVTATYKDTESEKTYEKTYELKVGGTESPLSISLTYNDSPVSHLAGPDPVFQIQTSTIGSDTFKFAASLEGGTTSNVNWSIEQREYADVSRGYVIRDSEDSVYQIAYTNSHWSKEETSWKEVAEGTEIAQLNKTTGEFTFLLDPDVYPNSMTFFITATTADGQYSKTDILFVAYLPVKFYLENNDATNLVDRHSASFTKGQETTVTVKPVLTVSDKSETITEDILNSLKLCYGQYRPGITEALVEDYTVVPNTTAGTATFTFTIPEDSSEDYLYIMGSYDHGEPTIMAENGIHTATLRIESSALASEGIAGVSIEDSSGSDGKYAPGEYTKISLSAQAYSTSGPVYGATYGWKVLVDGNPSDLVKLKFTESSPSAELWILGLTEGEIKVEVLCSKAGTSEDAASTSYTLIPAVAEGEEEPVE